MRIEGRTILLTGATGGLGRAIASALAERGATMLLSSRKQDELVELSDSLPGTGHSILRCDLAEDGAAEHLLDTANERAGGLIDALVANAGLPGTGGVESFDRGKISRVLRVNLEAPMQMAQLLAPRMVERGSGHLVFISSLSGKAATPRSSVYCATKFGLRGFGLALREDLRGTGVGASVVMPGFIREAGMFADAGAKPPPGLGTSSPEEVGKGVVTAIERDRGEVHVAPFLQRTLANLALRRPELAGRAGRRGGSTRHAENLARGQAPKR